VSESTLVAFPNFVGGITGISYVRIGVRKVWATLTDGSTLSIPRREFPPVLPDGNELAFAVARKLADGPRGEGVQS
jgi:hypothetical protein